MPQHARPWGGEVAKGHAQEACHLHPLALLMCGMVPKVGVLCLHVGVVSNDGKSIIHVVVNNAHHGGLTQELVACEHVLLCLCHGHSQLARVQGFEPLSHGLEVACLLAEGVHCGEKVGHHPPTCMGKGMSIERLHAW